MEADILVGIDVGSTTVKAVAIERKTKNLLWKDYQFHGAHQPEMTLDFFLRIEKELNLKKSRFAVFATGSGSGKIADLIGARYVQEVNAVTLAVRAMFPDVRSVVELGGQDAKIIIFREDPRSGAITTSSSMNDKCASGTGATIEKIAKKIGISDEALVDSAYLAYVNRLVPIAAKCGVFAETDAVGHLKAGHPEGQILASLFDAIVLQNLSVLTRGHTLRPKVLLLGGPNTFLKGLVEAWRYHIPKVWEERNIACPDDTPLEELITVPENAQYFAALGAVQLGLIEGQATITDSVYRGHEPLKKYIETGRRDEKARKGAQGLWRTRGELKCFLEEFQKKEFKPAVFSANQVVDAYLGIDGGSTSTKAVIIDSDRNVLAKSYMLSKGNPVQDTKDCIKDIQGYVESFGATLIIKGVGTTGYARDILADMIGADTRIVETVAHTIAARQLCPDVDVIVDVGGQDIKLITLQDGRVTDFRLNTQCSAGNGYFLQSTAEAFGIDIDHFAEVAFEAESMPVFGYGCAVFMQSDIVNFQREGWTKKEIMAGLAAVLPKNIWLYVSRIPNFTALGKIFVLQGGTQHNLAAVKAQVDFIKMKFAGKIVTPQIVVHNHCAEAGAIGAAVEALQVHTDGRPTTFIGLDQAQNIEYYKTSDERTRCTFCKNNCTRTFIDVKLFSPQLVDPHNTKVPLKSGFKRIITGFSCDRGTVESAHAMRSIKVKMDEKLNSNPNTVFEMEKLAFKPINAIPAIPEPRGIKRYVNRVGLKRINEKRRQRKSIRIGIPKVLNIYNLAPFFMAYFSALGVESQQIVFSQSTNEKMYRKGSKRGAVDPCFPSKLGIPHVYDLLYRVHKKRPLDFIFFPMIDSFPSPLIGVAGHNACPTVAATPEAVKAAFTKETDTFAEFNVAYLNPLLNLDNRPLLRNQLLAALKEHLSVDRYENDLAVTAGLKALEAFDKRTRQRGREVIELLEKERRFGFVVLARPYHNDAGINHEILLRLQRLGYPILAQDSLPTDEEFITRLFSDDLRKGLISHPMDIGDVWPTAYSENTSRKIWASKVIARHPNLIALELSSFRCGHDAPSYTIVERIVRQSKKPFFTFRDLDENAPDASISIRIQTIDYFLKQERTHLLESDRASASQDISVHKEQAAVVVEEMLRTE